MIVDHKKLGPEPAAPHSEVMRCWTTLVGLGLMGLSVAGCMTRERPRVAAPEILSRAAWQATPPVAAMPLHRIVRLTLHHTAVPQNPHRTLTQKLQALQKFSQQPGTLGNGKPKPAWPDVPYHFYIDCQGNIGTGRELRFVGDTNTSYDPTGHALVVLEGNFEIESPPPAQLTALRQLLAWLAAEHRLTADRLGGHRDYAETLCPGKNLEALLPELRAALPPPR